MRWLLLSLLVVRCSLLVAQVDSTKLPFSENGWYLSPHGTIRILVLFAEIEYDKNPAKDPQPGGSDHWPKGQLPKWKDNVFDPQPLPVPKAMLSRYYHDISLGDYVVLGDYVDQVLTLRESEHANLSNWSAAAIEEANKLGVLHTAHNMGIDDFDLWKDGGKPGLSKESGADSPHSYDHVMTILRNSGLTHGQGSTDPGSSGKLYGFESDTQSRFGGMNALPFEILKHEFNHLLLGGNNFHSGGGNAPGFESCFLSLQGGWSIMGAANSSLLTCSSWDRDRLGWRAADAAFRFNARTGDGAVVNADLDAVNGDTGVFILRDFVTSGDALRIKLPYLDADEFPQWILVENHQGSARNGSPTDRFHWDDGGNTCIEHVAPGLFMQLQVDHDKKRGTDIYGGYADYLHPFTANGHWDFRLTEDTVLKSCPFHGTTVAYSRYAPNPFTGTCEEESPLLDRNGDKRLERGEGFMLGAESRNDGIHDHSNFFGRASHAFTMEGVRKLGMATNPSSANALTLVSSKGRDKFHGAKPNNRVVHLNGISIELLGMAADGAATVRVRANDTYIDDDARWCADSIVLHAMAGHRGYALWLAPGRRITIDRSRTPTRLDRAEELRGTTWFSDPTHMVIQSGAHVKLDVKARLELLDRSELHLMSGVVMELDPSARITVEAGSRIVLHGDARIQATPKQVKKLKKKGRLVNRP